MCFKTVKIPLKRRCFGSMSRVTNLWFSFPPGSQRWCTESRYLATWLPQTYVRPAIVYKLFFFSRFSPDADVFKPVLMYEVCHRIHIPGNSQQLIWWGVISVDWTSFSENYPCTQEKANPIRSEKMHLVGWFTCFCQSTLSAAFKWAIRSFLLV